MWLETIQDNAKEDIVVLLIGNKIDKVDEREVTTNEGMEFAKMHELGFMETSALDASNVSSAFNTII